MSFVDSKRLAYSFIVCEFYRLQKTCLFYQRLWALNAPKDLLILSSSVSFVDSIRHAYSFSICELWMFQRNAYSFSVCEFCRLHKTCLLFKRLCVFSSLQKTRLLIISLSMSFPYSKDFFKPLFGAFFSHHRFKPFPTFCWCRLPLRHLTEKASCSLCCH